MKVHGANIILTGASRGIGEAAALELSRRGANLLLAARSRDLLEEVAAEARKEGVEVHSMVVDVADDAQVRAMVKRAEKHFGRVDVLINNAGLGLASPVSELDPDDLAYVFKVNVIAPLVAIRAVLPSMLDRGSGHIVNVGSVASHIASPNLGGYSATKFALKAMSDSLRMEVRDQGVAVTLICPGAIKTDFVVNSRGEPEGRLPLKPVGAPVDQVGRAIANAIARRQAEVFVPAYYQALVGANAAAPQVMRLAGKELMKFGTDLAERFMG